MKLISVLRKTVREQLRDVWTLVLTLALTPFFLLVYWLMFGGGSTSYDVLLLNADQGASLAGVQWNAGHQIAMALEAARYENGSPILDVATTSDRAGAEQKLRDRDAALLIDVPADFSAAIQSGEPKSARLTFVGDVTNPYYSIASMIVSGALSEAFQTMGGDPGPVAITEQALGGSAARSEFEVWVPGLLMLAATMLIYQAAITIAREIESGTVRRLQIAPVTSLDLLGGIGVSQVILGVLSTILAFVVAGALGFHSEGPIGVAVLFGGVTSVAMVCLGLMVACFARTVSRAYLLANFPLFLVAFFSGIYMPVSNPAVITVAGRSLGVLDVLPPKHGVEAINKVVTLGAGLGDVLFELVALTVLAVLYFAAGVVLFDRMYLRRG